LGVSIGVIQPPSEVFETAVAMFVRDVRVCLIYYLKNSPAFLGPFGIALNRWALKGFFLRVYPRGHPMMDSSFCVFGGDA